MKFYLSTISDVSYDWDETTQNEEIHYSHIVGPIAKEHKLGLELAEFCISENCEYPEKVQDFFLENLNNYTNDVILHAPYNELFPHAIEPMLIDIAWKRYEEAYELCEKYHIPKMIVHGNFVPSLYFPQWYIKRQIEFWSKFLAQHQGKCIICMENVMENGPELITDIIKGVNNPRLRMCLDLGHANVHPEHEIDYWIKECAPFISHLHVHNNQGYSAAPNGMSLDKHKGLGNGIIDYNNAFKLCNDFIQNDYTVTIESFEFKESIQWLYDNKYL